MNFFVVFFTFLIFVLNYFFHLSSYIYKDKKIPVRLNCSGNSNIYQVEYGSKLYDVLDKLNCSNRDAYKNFQLKEAYIID